MLREAPSDEATSDPRIAGANPFPINPAIVSVPATKQTEPAGIANCGGETLKTRCRDISWWRLRLPGRTRDIDNGCRG